MEEIKEWISKDRWCVYKHTAPNGKIYIGITNNTKNRWRSGGIGYKSQSLFWRAIQKYGWDNFDHEIIAWDMELWVAQRMEMDLIKFLYANEREYGYNLTDGGETIPTIFHTPESVKKALETKRKKLEAGIHPAHYGKKFSLERRKKLSEAHKGLNSGVNHPMYGKHHTEEAKEKLRKANLGKKYSQETQQKKREKMLGRFDGEKHPMYGTKHSEEHRSRISESLKKAYAEGRKTPVNVQSKKVYQYSFGGKYLGEYQSCVAASKAIGRSPAGIVECANGKSATCGGYIWKYFKMDKIETDPEKLEKNSIRKKKVYQYTLDGEFVSEFETITSAAKAMGIKSPSISRCLNNPERKSCGYLWTDHMI